MGTHLKATERHLLYRITQCYLPPDTGERAPPFSKPNCLVLDLPILERWKAELTLAVSYIPRWFTYLQTVTHAGTLIVVTT